MRNFYFTKYLFIGLLLISAINAGAQELILGGDMESADNWTVVEIVAGNGHIETFGYTDDAPLGGEGGCLSMSGSGNWSNAAVCQEITVMKGVEYHISLVIKTALDYEPNTNWTEVVVVPEMPVVDEDITAHPNSFALNSWDCADVVSVDGNFADFNCDAKSPLKDTIYYEGTGDTTVVLVLKVGGNNEYNVLLDNVSVYGLGGVSIDNTTSKPALNVFPNPTNDLLTIEADKPDQYSIEITSLNGQLIYSTIMDGTAKEIDMSEYSRGVYFVTVKSKEFVRTEKIIKL